MKKISFSFLIGILGFFSSAQDVDAQAYCALRDPVSSIKQLFPESNQHRSLVRAINADVRDKISERLPFTLHFNELGKHTLYVAQKYGDAVGFVHVRSELTQWGLIEIAWALDTDLTIRDLRFQRCRIPDCEGKHMGNILNVTSGKSYGELLEYINIDGQTLKPEIAAKFSDSPEFALAAIRSALKTIAVTYIAWQTEIADINRQRLLNEYFGHEYEVSLNPIEVSASQQQELDKLMGGGGSMIDRESISSFQLTRENDDIGTMVTATWREGVHQGMFNWLFDPDGKIIAIQPIPAWRSAEISQSFEELQGMNLFDLEKCNTATQLIGYELYFLSHERRNEYVK